MAGEYAVKASEIKALSPEARRSLAAWDARVRALPVPGDKPQKPAIGVQIELDVAPMRERRPLPVVLVMPPRADRLIDQPGRAGDALELVERAWSTDGWEKQRDPCTVIRYQAPDGQCGVIHVREDEAATIARTLTKGARASRAARVDVPTPAAVAVRAALTPAEDARLPEAIATIATLMRQLAERDAAIAALRAEIAARLLPPAAPAPITPDAGIDPWADYQAGIAAARRMMGAA